MDSLLVTFPEPVCDIFSSLLFSYCLFSPLHFSSCVCSHVTQIYFLVIYNSWTPLANSNKDCGDQFILKSLIKKKPALCTRVCMFVLCVWNSNRALSLFLSPPSQSWKRSPLSSHQRFCLKIVLRITVSTLSRSLSFHQRSKRKAGNVISLLMFEISILCADSHE